MIVFNDTLGVYGGSQTLMLRMCTWLREHEEKVAIICTSRSNVEIVGRLESIGVEVIVIDRRNIHELYLVIMRLLNSENIKVYNFIWNFYLDVECIKSRYKLEFDNLIYCIHPKTFKKGIGFKTAYMKKYSVDKYRFVYKKMYDNNALIMMHEVDINESNKFLNLDLDFKNSIVRLPMCCDKPENREQIINNGYQNEIIMTAARADFPYKGYILGLINDFEILKKEFQNIKLEIISGGDDYDRIVEKISDLSEDIRKDVILHGWMDYEQLKENIKRCKIFVGMGTTVLDAALEYKPCVPVRFNTYETIGECLIGDNPDYTTPEEGCENKAIEIVRKVLDMDCMDYTEACLKSFSAVKETYDINNGMDILLNRETKNRACILSRKEVIRHMLNNMLNKIRCRNNNDYDYTKLKFEKDIKH
jgi:hypothetical protein